MKQNLRFLFSAAIPLLLAILMSSTVYAQEKQVTGKVTSSTDGIGLPGVNVQVKGTTTGTVTDTDGKYTISVKDNSATLVFSSIGFGKQELLVGSKSVLDVNLVDDVKSLSEVVVTGYGSQSKKEITGAVATLDSKQLLTTPATNLGQALQGKVPGVVIGNENSPGGGVSVRIRGFGTINDNSPLYVVDGVPTKGVGANGVSNTLNTLNLNDIESMQILKDASAASIYGSRAGNGVVIITTKRGKVGKPVFTYDTYYGTQRPGKLLDMLNTPQYADLTWKARINTLNQASMVDGAFPTGTTLVYPKHAQFGNGETPVIPDYIFPAGAGALVKDPVTGVLGPDPRLAQNPDGTYVNYSTDVNSANFNKTKWLITKANKTGTNWLKEIYQPAPIQNHQIGVSGGSETGRYAMSLNYFNQQGLMIHTSFKRYTLRSNTEFNISKRIRAGQNFQVGYASRIGQPNGNNAESNPTSFGYRVPPIVPVYDVAGNFAGTRGADVDNSVNPVSLLYRNKDNQQNEVRLFGNAYAEVDILKNLTAKTSFGIDYNLYNYRNYVPRDIESAEARSTQSLTTTNNYEWTWTWYNTLTYNVVLKDAHKLNIIAGTESIKNNYENFDASRTNFLVDALDNRFLSAGTGVQTNNGGGANWQLASEFGRASYSYSGRYLFDATIRRDRSSRFSAANNVAYFPAVSAGWVLSDESFAKSSANWLSYAKVRVGWGQTGNQEIGNLNPYTLYSTNPALSFYDINGAKTSATAGYELTQFGNPKAKWETTTSTNLGLDAALFKGTVDVAFDWYTRTTTDMLFPVAPPLTAGVAASPFQNIGSMRNRGVDLGISYNGKALDGDLTFTIGANFSTYRNVVTRTNGDPNTQYFGINDERIQNFVVTQQNHPISSFFGYKHDGIFQTDAGSKRSS
ncbi:SusC/RagA family TonB-linked outer membrane protein [Dyadobacter sp. NIV53]|uniref:SusC/RagA family TonB-linked outer membrane protein n=1 Tax=Dyadobacter sp. NIV53 TaxID=2861765 RepID=UPI00286E1F2D|nr:SusC/RagA family TonB-linked outer membrane protein [Dyadobacter sp. NIV53]